VNRLIKLVAGAGTALALTGSLTACGPTLGSLPLPGTGVSGDAITVKMDFADALNLAKGATVKVNGVSEGKVESIDAADFQAIATTKIRTDAQLHEGATARLRYTTPLGELFVDITNPAKGPLIKDGAELSTKQTSTAPTVEDALSEASLLINGGGLGQLQQVTTELNAAFGGNEGTFRDLLEQLNGFLIQANQTTHDIDTALNALSSVGQTLNQRRETINKALAEIKPAADVLRANTPDFTALLKSLQAFAAQANKTVGATKTQLLATIKEVEPILAEMAANKSGWSDSLVQLTKLADAVRQVLPGDYLNVNVKLSTDLSHLLGGLNSSGSGSGSGSGTGGKSGGGGGLLGGLLGGGTKGTTPTPAPSGSSTSGPSKGVCILVVCL
jgi:phospholipid/cholesterol/gamma-HCH transport system substrate-binding protein